MTTATLTTTQGWVVPAGVTSLTTAKAQAGGGGGGVATRAARAGGGGAAASVSNNIAVTPGETLDITIGAGGAAGASGGVTTVKRGATVLLSAYPGGAASGNTPGVGGSAASGVGTTKYAGGNGFATGGGGGAGSDGTATGANGTSLAGGVGIGTGGSGGDYALNGANYGGGGGGGDYAAALPNTQPPEPGYDDLAGSGAPGVVIFTYTASTNRVLTAAAGALAIVGAVAALKIARVLPAAAGALIITGSPATFTRAKTLFANPGALVITGSSATFSVSGGTTAPPIVNTVLPDRSPSLRSIGAFTIASLKFHQNDTVLARVQKLELLRTAILAVPVDLAVTLEGKPTATQRMLRYKTRHAIHLNASQSLGDADVAATASTVFTIKLAGAVIGNITFAAASATGVVTLTTTAVASGSLLEIYGPASPDATLSNITLVLAATRDI